LLTFSADGEPMLGPILAIEGLYVGVAFHSGGFAYNPVTGMLLAELVAEGKTRLDIELFSPARFSEKETREYLATTVPQKNAARRRH
jgi:sarcosine oxidase subunit beta